MATKLTTSELAERLDAPPKKLRKFLRSDESPVPPVGKGNRYYIDAAKFRSLKRAYAHWSATHTRNAA